MLPGLQLLNLDAPTAVGGNLQKSLKKVTQAAKAARMLQAAAQAHKEAEEREREDQDLWEHEAAVRTKDEHKRGFVAITEDYVKVNGTQTDPITVEDLPEDMTEEDRDATYCIPLSRGPGIKIKIEEKEVPAMRCAWYSAKSLANLIIYNLQRNITEISNPTARGTLEDDDVDNILKWAMKFADEDKNKEASERLFPQVDADTLRELWENWAIERKRPDVLHPGTNHVPVYNVVDPIMVFHGYDAENGGLLNLPRGRIPEAIGELLARMERLSFERSERVFDRNGFGNRYDKALDLWVNMNIFRKHVYGNSLWGMVDGLEPYTKIWTFSRDAQRKITEASEDLQWFVWLQILAHWSAATLVGGVPDSSQVDVHIRLNAKKFLRKSFIEPNYRYPAHHNSTLLFPVAEFHNVEEIFPLFFADDDAEGSTRRWDINATDGEGATALDIAASWWNLKAVVKLLRYGADPNYASDRARDFFPNGVGFTPLMSALRNPDTTYALQRKHDIVDALINVGGARVNTRHYKTRKTPLMAAATHAGLKTIELLLETNRRQNIVIDVDVVNAQSEFGSTALHFAVDKQFRLDSLPDLYGVVGTLLAHRADPCIENNWGVSPLDIVERTERRQRDSGEVGGRPLLRDLFGSVRCDRPASGWGGRPPSGAVQRAGWR